VEEACIVDAEGNLFASYSWQIPTDWKPPEAAAEPVIFIGGDYINLQIPIRRDDERLGTIFGSSRKLGL
jgi:hypothetical protein